MPDGRRESDAQGRGGAGLPRVLLVCLLVAAASYGVYEVVERTWFAGAGRDVLHAFHLLRGLAAAALASAVATMLLLHRRNGSGRPGDLPSAARSWKKRLELVTLRTKVVVPMVALAVLPTLAIGLFTISRMRSSLREDAIQHLEFDTESKARGVRDLLHLVQQDLRYIRETRAIRELVGAPPGAAPASGGALRARAEIELTSFFQDLHAYCRFECLLGPGEEAIRLDVEPSTSRMVPSARRPKGVRQFPQVAASAMKPGEISVTSTSIVTLHGDDAPLQGVVRYATPVAGSDGRIRGVLVVSLCLGHILSRLGPLSPGTEAWLVDQEGIYLGYVGDSEEKRSHYSLDRRRPLSADYAGVDLPAVLRGAGGRRTIATELALVSFAPIVFDEAAPGRSWTLLIGHRREPIEAPIRYLTVFLTVVTAMVAAVAGVVGVLVANYLARPVAILRRATREIAAGDLEKRVDIDTGDEIEALATDFNTMAERLQEARQRLSSWNEELTREVAVRTDHLHQLQVGLARVDKLASMGQMTAAVMHEIGNPLAAIKTKIQVAEEEGQIGGGCRPLMSEVIGEVDRLSAFLHTFSRLARLRESRDEVLSLAEVVRGVAALVTPELRRRGLSLRVESSDDAPTIQGDADRLRHLLINLVLNAAEATRDRGEILVRVRRQGPGAPAGGPPGVAVVEVVDQGAGIPEEIMDRIWDPFFTTKPEGSGLGLPICREIVEEHGGTIRIQTRPGEGTSVSVILPAAGRAGESP